jgi:pyruvate formate lyase activating enzyme
LDILAAADLFLYDLKVMDPARHLELTGVSNRWILANLKTLSECKKPTILRFPAIPGLTDAPENVCAVAAFVHDLKTIRRISVLPYHRIAEGKYRKLKDNNRMKGIETLDRTVTDRIRDQFESYGFTVTVGG